MLEKENLEFVVLLSTAQVDMSCKQLLLGGKVKFWIQDTWSSLCLTFIPPDFRQDRTNWIDCHSHPPTHHIPPHTHSLLYINNLYIFCVFVLACVDAHCIIVPAVFSVPCNAVCTVPVSHNGQSLLPDIHSPCCQATTKADARFARGLLTQQRSWSLKQFASVRLSSVHSPSALALCDHRVMRGLYQTTKFLMFTVHGTQLFNYPPLSTSDISHPLPSPVVNSKLQCTRRSGR